MKRSLLLALLLLLGLVLGACNQSDNGDDGDTDGGTTVDLSYDLVDTAYAGVSGTVEFEELDNGDIQATIDLGTTAEAGASYPAHIHAGDAGSNGEIVVPLDNVVDGESVTTFNALEDGTTVTIESLETYDGYVNVHLPDNLDIVVASANIGANTEVEVPVPGTIAEIAEANGSFTTLLSALTAAELAATFSTDGGPYTVLAPTDEAFADLLTELGVTADELLERDDLADILSYHVIDDAIPASEVTAAAEAGGSVDTLLTGDPVEFSLEGETVVVDERADVETTNIVTSNGLIHVIDAVLLPNAEEATTVEVELSGENEVPAVESEFEGEATVALAGTTLSVEGSYSEGMVIAGPGAHIHGPADATANADVLFPLEFDNTTSTFTGSFDLSEGVTSSGDVAYTAEELLGFFATGQLYINLHTEANPAGELRGQIVPETDEEEDTDETN